MNELRIGGFQKQSLIDFPGYISSIVFTLGCNFRCGYCHNPELVIPEKSNNAQLISEIYVLNWIHENKELLDAVVITGGEPTIHPELPRFIRAIKEMKLKVKLDTNGTNPDLLKGLIIEGLLDYIAMDIKAPLDIMKYNIISGVKISGELFNRIFSSISLITNSKINYEFRTTLDEQLTPEDIMKVIQTIKGKYFLQQVQNNEKYDLVSEQQFNSEQLQELIAVKYPDHAVYFR